MKTSELLARIDTCQGCYPQVIESVHNEIDLTSLMEGFAGGELTLEHLSDLRRYVEKRLQQLTRLAPQMDLAPQMATILGTIDQARDEIQREMGGA